MKIRISILLILLFLLINQQSHCQQITSLKNNIIEISINPLYQKEDSHENATTISNKGNTSDLSLRELYWYTYQKESELDKIMLLQQEDGSFPDIQYDDPALSNWSPTNHATRLLYLARAYITPGTKYYKKKEVSQILHRGINFWFRSKLVCKNWWYNEIGIPKTLGLVFLFMENELSPQEKADAVVVMNHSDFKQTGQNKVWQAGNVFLKALLLNDEQLALRARDSIASEIYQTTNEGIQPDFSFHQHGPQQQFGNYGLAYISSMAYFANVFRGTKFAFSNSQINTLKDYVLDGESWVAWRGFLDVSACNRQLFKKAQIGKVMTLCVAVNQLSKADPLNESKYSDLIKRNLQPGILPEKAMAKHFWNSELTVFRDASSYISVRSCSPRVKGTEFTNNENKQGHYISDGCTIFMRNGDEYNDIFPIWDWNRIPGVTAPLIDPAQAHTKTDDYKNPNPFVGGLTNGKNGISTFHLARNGVDAKKSWFYLDGVFVCLGANITSKIGKEIITDVNQCLQKGSAEIVFNNSKKISTFDTLFNSTKIKTVWHDSIGYYFPKSISATILFKNQTGDWHKVADPYTDEKVSGNIFNLWINHGVNAMAYPSYEYIVLPSISQKKLNDFAQKPSIEILQNNKDIQAVKSKNNNLFEFVFHKQGKIQTFSENDFIDSKTLGLIMLEQDASKNITLTVAEPTQLKKTFKLSLTGKYTGKNAIYNSTTKQTDIKIQLPQGGEAGKCVTIKLVK